MMGTFRRVGETVGRTVVEQVGRAAARVQERAPLPADLLESDDGYLVVFDAPGAQASDVQVRYSDGAVLVRVDRFRELREGFKMRFPGRGLSLDGRVELPEEARIDPEHASATLGENGTLEVRIPKRLAGEETSDGSATADPGVKTKETDGEPEEVDEGEEKNGDTTDGSDTDSGDSAA